MNKTLFSLLAFILVACSPQVTVTSEVTATLTPQVENTQIIPTPTEAEMTLSSLAQDIRDGKAVDTSTLTPEQQAQLAQELDGYAGELAQLYIDNPDDFSLEGLPLEFANLVRHEIAEQMKAKGLVHVTFDAGGSNPAYIDPEKFTMRQLNDGRSKAEQSIQMYCEVQVDAEGYLWMTNLQGEQVRIEGSPGVDWNQIITDHTKNEIDWPDTPVGKSGLPDAQWFLTLDTKTAYTPAVLLSKTVGEFYFKPSGKMRDTMPFYKIVTDDKGNPLYARLLLISPPGTMAYFEEGSAINTGSYGTKIPYYNEMLQEMEENSIYYLGIETNQAAIVSNPDPNAGYTGIVDETQSGDVLLGKKINQDELLLIFVRMLIQAKTK